MAVRKKKLKPGDAVTRTLGNGKTETVEHVAPAEVVEQASVKHFPPLDDVTVDRSKHDGKSEVRSGPQAGAEQSLNVDTSKEPKRASRSKTNEGPHHKGKTEAVLAS